MINTAELRKENLINYHDDDTLSIIKGIDADDFGITVFIPEKEDELWIECDRFSPISLTEEWLSKFGFYRASGTTELWSFGNTMLIWKTDYESDMLENYYEFRFGITSSYKAHREVRIDYVHQLQNLTYILTGQELTINP